MALDRSLNPNRSLGTPDPFPMGRMRHSGILPASVRILFPAMPRGSPLRLRSGQKHAAWHKRAISPKSSDRLGLKAGGILRADRLARLSPEAWRVASG